MAEQFCVVIEAFGNVSSVHGPFDDLQAAQKFKGKRHGEHGLTASVRDLKQP